MRSEAYVFPCRFLGRFYSSVIALSDYVSRALFRAFVAHGFATIYMER